MVDNRLALVVEDDALNILAITSLLTKMGIRYKRNTTGAHVTQQARDLLPDFILLDMDLPAGDPFLIREDLYADPLLRHIPIIAISDPNLVRKLQPSLSANQFAAYMSKPLCQPDLDGVLHRILGLPSFSPQPRSDR